MVTLTYDLDIYSDRVAQSVHLSQYDSDFTLAFNIYSSYGVLNIESGTTAKIRCTKPDGNGYSKACTMSGSLVSLEGDNQLTACAGTFPAEIVLMKDSKELSTINFTLDIERAPMDAGTVPSESVIMEIDDAVQRYMATHDIVIDSTLSKFGKAADAKATGLAVNKVRAGLESPARIPASLIEQGTFKSDTGKKLSANNRVRLADTMVVNKGASISFTPGTNVKYYVLSVFDADGNLLKIYPDWMSDTELSLEFSSDTGYIMFAFKKADDSAVTPEEFDADVSIVQKVVYKHIVTLERGAIDTSSDNRFSMMPSRHTTNRRNSHPIMLNGAKTIVFPKMPGTAIALFANANDVYTSRVNLNTVNPLGTAITVPSDAVYVDLDVLTQTMDEFEIECYDGDGPYDGKRTYKNSGNTIVIDIDVEHESDTYTCMAIKLPPNYSADGAKVPVFLWLAGTGGYTRLYGQFQGGVTQTGIEYLRDEGFAVLQVFSAGAYYYNKYPGVGWDMPYPVPIAEHCINSGLKYFADRYNVDGDNIHVIGLSFGGIMGFEYVLHPAEGMKSVTLFDPCIDTLSMRGRFSDARKLLVEELGMSGDTADFFDINEDGTTASGVENYYFSERCQTFWQANMPDLIRINPAWHNLIGNTLERNYNLSIADARLWWRGTRHGETDVYTHHEYKMISTLPLKIVGAMDDDSTPHQIMLEKVDQLRNSGNPVESVMVPSGGHTSTSTSDNTPYIEDITTALGILCEDVPIGWIEAVKFARKNM